jgi:hypothetical protein
MLPESKFRCLNEGEGLMRVTFTVILEGTVSLEKDELLRRKMVQCLKGNSNCQNESTFII